MCGIFGYIGKNQQAAEIVLEGLKKLEYRGYDSWGVAAVAVNPTNPTNKPIRPMHNSIAVKKKIGKIGNATVADMPKSSLAIGHTRWATHGGVTEANSHPHCDCTGTIAVVHNGIVENFSEIKNTLVKKQHVFLSQTDTEVIAHLIEEYKEQKPFDQAVRLAFDKLDGSNAVVAVSADNGMVVAIRNGSPLVLGISEEEYFIASDAAALLPHTQRVQFLEDGDMVVLSYKKVQIIEAQTGKEKPVKPVILDWTVKETEKGMYSFFMEKEIYEQPGIIKKIVKTSQKDILRIVESIRKSYGTYMIGCGSASYVALAGSYLFSTIARRHVNWAVGSEFGYYMDFLTDRSVIIAFSQSGETMDILESVKQAKEKGATVIAITNVAGSTLARIADDCMMIGAGPEIGVASTKAVTGKLAIATLLAYGLVGDISEGAAILTRAVLSMETLLETRRNRIHTLVQQLKDTEHIYVTGRGISYPVSLETALKIKEISYIHAEGMAGGELKHGPLALIEQGTPCLVFAPEDETYAASIAGAMEMKARGGSIIGISSKPHEVFDDYLEVVNAKVATMIPQIVVGQLLGYELSIAKGFDPDKPRNLAKSVTVK